MMNLYVSMLALSIAWICLTNSDNLRKVGSGVLMATLVLNILDCLGVV